MKKLFVLALLTLGVAIAVQAAEETNRTITSVSLSTTSVPASLVFSGAGTIYGVVLTTGATSNYCILRDTGTVNITSTALLPRFVFATASPQLLQFNTPIRVTNGLSVNLGNTPLAGTEECSVLYRKGRLW